MALSRKVQTDNQPSSSHTANDGLQARLIALHLLNEVLQRKKALDDVIKSDADYNALSGLDRGFARMLAATTLRRMGQIDAVLLKAMDQGEYPKPQRLHDVLRIGLTQIFFMDVPDHAAVDTTVRLAREKQRGFVNAVMRRMTAEGREWIKDTDESLNIPAWLYSQWMRDYGADAALSIARASLSEASLDITVKIEDETMIWAGTLEASKLSGTTIRRAAGGRVENLSGFEQGAWWVQDASAALPARLFGDVRGQHVIDMCCAPGGKTMQLAAMGANVTAVDRSATRMKKVHENLDRLGLSPQVETIVSDGSIWQPKEPSHFVLLDAPCTATGTIRRHPDILHLKEENDQMRLIDIQARLLRNAAQIVQSGGTLIYCTCSLQKEESEYQIEAFLSDNADFTIDPINSGEIGGAKDAIDKHGFARILPFHMAARGGMDGFFIARLRKS
ncbi:MAG: RsmB/NOP family class I SAM-dependent RNA methyltransferase [Pseudomonadota bacterium]